MYKTSIFNFILQTWNILKESFRGFIKNNDLKLSASLSYYTIFSLPPLIIIIITLCGIFFGKIAVRGEIVGQISGVVGNNAALQIQEIIKNVNLSHSGTFATVISVILLIIGASSVFAEIQDSINLIWNLEGKPKRVIVKFLINRLMSFILIASVGILLLFSLIVNSLIYVLNQHLLDYMPIETISLLSIFNSLIVFIIITILLIAIFKILPDGKIALRDCIIGASFTAFLFVFGKFLISFYLRSSTIATVYGAAGSVILILAWVYYSAIILYFGAEFTREYAKAHGRKIIPNYYSVEIANEPI